MPTKKKYIIIAVLGILAVALGYWYGMPKESSGGGGDKKEPAFLKQGLVTYYPFNGNAKDESGNGNDGEVNGVIFSRNRLGDNKRAALFSGQRPHILVRNPDGRFNLQQFTLSAWVTVTNNSDWQPIIYKIAEAGTNKDNYIFYFTQGNKIALRVEQTDGEDCWIISDFKHNNKHINVVGTYGDHELKVYVNGVLKGKKKTAPRNLYAGEDAELLIGSSINRRGGSGISQTPFEGVIDDVRIYNRALSEAEVKALYEFEKPKTQQASASPSPSLPW